MGNSNRWCIHAQCDTQLPTRARTQGKHNYVATVQQFRRSRQRTHLYIQLISYSEHEWPSSPVLVNWSKIEMHSATGHDL